MCCIALNVPILSHELYPINIPWNRGSYPHRLQHAFTSVEVGKPTPQSSRVSNGGPKQGWQKKNVGDLQGIIGVEPMTNWGKIQQLVSNQWIILRENPPENFLGGFWGRCSLERHFVGTKWDPDFFTGKHSLIRSFWIFWDSAFSVWWFETIPRIWKPNYPLDFWKNMHPPTQQQFYCIVFLGPTDFPSVLFSRNSVNAHFGDPKRVPTVQMAQGLG